MITIKKQVLLLSFLAVISYSINAMEQEPSSQWQRLPYELQQIVIARALPKTGTLEDILNRLTELGENPLFSNLVHNETFRGDVARRYISHHQKTVNDEFVDAAEKNKLAVIQALLLGGVDVNTQNENGNTGLMKAARNGYIEMVRRLIKSGADVNTKNNNGWTALILASYKRNEANQEIVVMLIAAGANVNDQNECGYTALVKAVQNDLTDVVKTLIKAGANVNSKEPEWGTSETALETASHGGHKEIIKILIASGADVNLYRYQPAITYAIEKKDKKTIKRLINAGADVNQGDRYRTPLRAAVRNNDEEIVIMLIDAGADVNVIYDNRKTVLGEAQHNGKIVKILEAAGATYGPYRPYYYK